MVMGPEQLKRLSEIRVVGGEFDGMSYKTICEDREQCAKVSRSRTADKAALRSYAIAVQAFRNVEESSEVAAALKRPGQSTGLLGAGLALLEDAVADAPDQITGAPEPAAPGDASAGEPRRPRRPAAAGARPVALGRRLRMPTKSEGLGFKYRGDLNDLWPFLTKMRAAPFGYSWKNIQRIVLFSICALLMPELFVRFIAVLVSGLLNFFWLLMR